MENLGLNQIEANALVDQYIKDPITKMHLWESQAIMEAVSKRLGEDPETWGIIGLLHDIDWDKTKDDVKNHCILAQEILRSAGGTDFLIQTIASHGYGHDTIPDLKDKKRTLPIEHCLTAAETLTGIIVASALVCPDKKLASVKLTSLKKKFKSKSFAAKCNRELVRECELAGIPLDEFLGIGLVALQRISGKLGL